jgi:hypothetical protein
VAIRIRVTRLLFVLVEGVEGSERIEGTADPVGLVTKDVAFG